MFEEDKEFREFVTFHFQLKWGEQSTLILNTPFLSKKALLGEVKHILGPYKEKVSNV